MDRIYERCCGLDVHKNVIVAFLRVGNKSETRNFCSTTNQLVDLAEWLREAGRQNESAGKRYSGKTRKGNNTTKSMCEIC